MKSRPVSKKPHPAYSLQPVMSQEIFDPTDLTVDGLSVMYKTYILTFQTLAFGEYLVSPVH